MPQSDNKDIRVMLVDDHPQRGTMVSKINDSDPIDLTPLILQKNCNDRTPVGEIHLKGHWPIQAGFTIDAPVTIRVMEWCQVLTTEL